MRTHLRTAFLSLMAIAVMGVFSAAKADTISATCAANVCTVSGTNSQGNPVNSTATFTFGAGTISVSLTNNLTNSQVVAANQLFTGVYFTTSSGAGFTLGANSSAQSTNLTAAASGATAALAGAVSPTGWALGSAAGFNVLCVICPAGISDTAPQAEQGIIGGTGSGIYANANSSLLGSSHNPFLVGPVNFSINAPGVTANTQLTSVFLQFNTDSALPPPTTNVPEPASMFLMGSGLVSLVAGLRRRRNNKA